MLAAPPFRLRWRWRSARLHASGHSCHTCRMNQHQQVLIPDLSWLLARGPVQHLKEEAEVPGVRSPGASFSQPCPEVRRLWEAISSGAPTYHPSGTLCAWGLSCARSPVSPFPFDSTPLLWGLPVPPDQRHNACTPRVPPRPLSAPPVWGQGLSHGPSLKAHVHLAEPPPLNHSSLSVGDPPGVTQ